MKSNIRINGFLFSLTLIFIFIVEVSGAFALSVLVRQAQTGTYFNYGYNEDRWLNMTQTLDDATSDNVDVVLNFENLEQLLNYDALWIDYSRGDNQDPNLLSATEVDNIRYFINTGRRVVMMGENHSWTLWNNSILNIVGGSYSGLDFSGVTASVVSNELTNGVDAVGLLASGVANDGGISLFDQNFATLWGENVLTILDVNVFDDENGNLEDNMHFALNAANWIASSSSVPNIDAILDFFDQSVSGGSITGYGHGNSANNRLDAFRKKLQMASDLIDIGDTDGACVHLEAASKKCDGITPPPDFVMGESVSELYVMITELMAELGCE
jgi:hypothetical protein